MISSEEESEGVDSNIWTEYGGEVVEDKTGKDRVYTKWKPPKNKLTQEIQRKKTGKRKSLVPETPLDKDRRLSKVDTAMTAVSAGPGKSASQIFFYDWSDNYRRVIKEMKAQEALQGKLGGSVSGESILSSPRSILSTERAVDYNNVPLLRFGWVYISGTKGKGSRKLGTIKVPTASSLLPSADKGRSVSVEQGGHFVLTLFSPGSEN